MGARAYTLTTICNPDPTLPALSLAVKKEEKENSKVSSIGSITIQVNNMTVTAVQSENEMVREERISASHWRKQLECSLTCPPNSTYSTCGFACLPTCNIPAVSSSCAAVTTCVDTCVCHEGLVLDANT
ncbi:alpha-tectorin-like [Ammospiza maritima maritima]